MNRLVIVAAGLLLVASFGAGLLYSGVIRLDDSPLSQIAKPNIGGPFQLTDQNGKPFSTEQLKGKPYLVFFGFTHCPDVCPTTLMEVTNHMADPAIKDSGLRALFVSVDPSRDTPELLKTYLSNFDPGIVGLTGTEEEIAEVAKKFRAYYARVPQGDDYTMDHVALVYMMDRNGEYADSFTFQEAEASRTKKLRRLVSANS